MFKDKLNLQEILFILINLLPVFGVWLEGWDPAKIFLFYCLETILIGIFQVIKMAIILMVSRPTKELQLQTKAPPLVLGIFVIFFFIFHYGIFVFVQTGMFFGISGIYKGSLSDLLDVHTLKEVLGNEGILMAIIFIVYYSLQSIREIATFRMDKLSSIVRLMLQPYGRVFVQQFVLIIGGMFLVFKLGKIFIIIFVVTRLYIELFFKLDNKLEKVIKKTDSAIIRS